MITSLALNAQGCSADDDTSPAAESGPGTAGTGGGTGTAAPSDIPAHCDALDTAHCAYPLPSNHFTVADDGTRTGIRLHYTSDILPISNTGNRTLADDLNQLDGFSPGIPMLTVMQGATLSGLATLTTIDASLETDSPTVIIRADTGERVPHFVELDQSGLDGERALMVRPVVRLEDATRYIVALRNIQDASGTPLPPSQAFDALKTGGAHGHASVEARRELFAEIFQKLQGAGISKDTLQIAWDFTTASRENTTRSLLHMRDDALERIEAADEPLYAITQVTPNVNEHTAFQIEGTVSVPLYMDEPKAGGALITGQDGLPVVNEATPWHDVPFVMLVPKASVETPGKLVLYGHGLLGEKEQIRGSRLPEFMNQYNYVFVSTDLVGMSHDGDEAFIANSLGGGKFHKLARTFDRLHQGTLNHVALMRIISTRFTSDETYGALLSQNPDERYYHGISQGGIFGGVFMAIATDVTRGVLGVMGQPYALLLDRSKDFDPFKGILRVGYSDRHDQNVLLNLAQGLWDRVEPNGYSKYIAENPLPGTPKHQVLMRAALGDHQVSTLGANLMARAVGAKHVDSGLREVWGLEKVQQTQPGTSGYVEYDFGLPEDPECNVPMRLCDDPHEHVRRLDAARQQMDHFLRTGEIKNFCENGECSFPELSGCTEDNNTPYLCAGE